MICGISFDDEEANRRFADKFHFPFDLLCDTTREVGLAYGACDDRGAHTARRVSYLIDPEGRIAKVYAKVTPAEHPAQVLRDVTTLGMS